MVLIFPSKQLVLLWYSLRAAPTQSQGHTNTVSGPHQYSVTVSVCYSTTFLQCSYDSVTVLVLQSYYCTTVLWTRLYWPVSMYLHISYQWYSVTVGHSSHCYHTELFVKIGPNSNGHSNNILFDTMEQYPNKINGLVLLCTTAAMSCFFYIDFNCQLLSHSKLGC